MLRTSTTPPGEGAVGAPPKAPAQHVDWHPTPEQEAANAKAAAHIAEHAAQMEQATELDKKPHTYSDGDVSWDFLSGATIESALKHTPLIDLQYLVALGRNGGVLPRGRQNVHPAAFITKANLWRLKLWSKKRPKYAHGVLVWSYPWLDAHHSDRLGTQLRRLLPVLEAMLAEAKLGSPYCTIGVMIDMLCLPQKQFASEAIEQQFKVSLKNINIWYYHETTYVLLVTTPPPEGGEYGNTRLHKERGRCQVRPHTTAWSCTPTRPGRRPVSAMHTT